MSIIKHFTLQKIVAHDFRYDPRISINGKGDEKETFMDILNVDSGYHNMPALWGLLQDILFMYC